MTQRHLLALSWLVAYAAGQGMPEPIRARTLRAGSARTAMAVV